MDKNRYKPLYDVLTGFDFNFRLQIFLSQVGEDTRIEFIENEIYF